MVCVAMNWQVIKSSYALKRNATFKPPVKRDKAAHRIQIAASSGWDTTVLLGYGAGKRNA